MPWKERCYMDERLSFISEYLSHEWSLSALCREYGISRRVGYKWIIRFYEHGTSGLTDQSRAPRHHPQGMSESVREMVLQARVAHPTWGARKLRAWLSRIHPETLWPAPSSIGELLHERGLTVSRRRSRRGPPYDAPLAHCHEVNRVWSADLKGWFLTADGQRCDPFTLTDNYSRMLLRCQQVHPASHETIQPIFVTAFREYGLPEAIRTDNGPPFATTTVGALSRLSVWFIRLGIIPERIRPGQPSENGRHERMHRTLKAETASPPRSSLRQQQRAFDRFRQEYNHERPHEALGQRTPASCYVCSPRPYPLRVPEMRYPEGMLIRTVHSQGDISWKDKNVYLSSTLAGELVGLEQLDDRYYDIWFGVIRLARLDSYAGKLVHYPKTRPRPEKGNNNPKVLPMSPV